MHPEVMLSPAATSRGADSPVNAAVLRLELPSTTMPSRGTRYDYISRFAAGGALLWSALCSIDALFSVTIGFLHKMPLFDLGLSWILPTVIFGLIGLAVAKATGAPNPSAVVAAPED